MSENAQTAGTMPPEPAKPWALLDFLAGLQRRAPAAVRGAKMEWLWRALSSPRRLGPRYIKGATILPGHLRDALRLRGRD